MIFFVIFISAGNGESGEENESSFPLRSFFISSFKKEKGKTLKTETSLFTHSK